MLLHEFPDLTWLKTQANANFASKTAWNGQKLPTSGWPNVILNAKCERVYRDNIRGPLSIFTNVSGKSMVKSGGKTVLVQPGHFFISNHDQYYTLQVNEAKTETLNIHFGEYFADQVLQSIVKHPGKLMDDGQFLIPLERLELFSKLYPRDSAIDTIMADLKMQNNKLLEEEKLYELFEHILHTNYQVAKQVSKIPATKNSTRTEIIRRLHASTDYMYSFFDSDLSLEELASVACLSKFHFLRLFKIAFNQTPHQFVTSIKISHAKSLLKNTALEVHAVARSLGFDNSNSFSRVFYNHLKVYPTQYRNMV